MKKTIGTLLFAVLSLCVSAEEDPGLNEYFNPTIGFRITKPAGWQFISAQQNLDSLKVPKLQDNDIREAMLKYAAAPLVGMLKYPEPYPDLNPSFKVNIKPLGSLKGKEAAEIASLMIPSLKRAFKDFKVIQPPTDVSVSGLKAAYIQVAYSLEVEGAGLFPTLSELWIVPRGDYFFMLGAGTRADEKTGSRQEIHNMVESIYIEP